jgi:hypothetical protein
VPINRSFNVLDVNCEITAGGAVSGMDLVWVMANARTYQCLEVAYVGLAGIAFLFYLSYCLTFVWFLYPENVVSMILFCASGVALNPLLYVFNIDIEYANAFFPFFVAAVKFHFIFGCNRLHGGGEDRTARGLFALFLGVYTSVDVAASIVSENKALSGGGIGWIELTRMAFHGAFAGIALVYHHVSVDRDDGDHLLRGRVLFVMYVFAAIPEFIADAVLPLADVAQGTIYGDVLKAVAMYGYFCAFSLFFKRKVGPIGIDPDSALFRIEDQAQMGEQDTNLFDG